MDWALYLGLWFLVSVVMIALCLSLDKILGRPEDNAELPERDIW